MTLQTLITTVQQLVADGKTESAFALLNKELVTLFPNKVGDLTLLNARYNQAHDDFILRGILSSSDYETRTAQINAAILDFLENLSKPSASQTAAANSNSAKPITNRSGKLLHNVPGKMTLGIETRCTVRIAVDELTVLKNFTPSPDTLTQDIRISEVMNVELIDFNGVPSFTVRALNEKEQFLDIADVTQWLFMVKPLRIGTFPITIKVSVIEIVNDKERKRDIVLEKNIEIATAPTNGQAQPFVETNIVVLPLKQPLAATAKIKTDKTATAKTATATMPQFERAVAASPDNDIPSARIRRSFPLGLVSSVALIIAVSIGSYFFFFKKGNDNTVTIVTTKPSATPVKPKPAPTLPPIDTTGEIATVEPPRKPTAPTSKPSEPAVAQRKPTKKYNPNDEVIADVTPRYNRVAKGVVIEKQKIDSITVRQPEDVLALRRIPNVVPSHEMKTTMEDILNMHRVYLANQKQFKQLFVFVDGETAKNIVAEDGFVRGFEFTSTDKIHNLRFMVHTAARDSTKGNYKFISCRMDSIEIVEKTNVITVCKLQ